MARGTTAKGNTRTLTIRFPAGVVAILDDAVERGMFTSVSDAIRTLIANSLGIAMTENDTILRPIEIASPVENHEPKEAVQEERSSWTTPGN